MRILTTTMCYPTAAHPDQGVFVQRRSLALGQIPGVSISVISPQPWCPILRASPGEALHGPLPACYPRMLSIPILGRATDGLAFSRAIEREVSSEVFRGRRPDVIDAHFEYPDGVGAWLAGKRAGIPVVVTVRGKIVSLSRKTLRRMQIAWMLRGVNARIAVSRSLAEWVRRVGGSDLKAHVIPNGIDRAVFHPLVSAGARASLRWDPSRRYVLAVGHQQYVKGFDRVLAAARMVQQVIPDVHFVLVGSTRGEPWFQSELRTLKMQCDEAATPEAPLVEFVAPVASHVLNLMYNAADLMLNASRSEGWCNAIAESLACGTPVVATDVGGNREQLSCPDLGTIVQNGEPAMLADAIVAALTRKWDRQAISSIGGGRTWNDTAREAYQVLAEAVRQNNPSPSPQVAGALP